MQAVFQMSSFKGLIEEKKGKMDSVAYLSSQGRDVINMVLSNADIYQPKAVILTFWTSLTKQGMATAKPYYR